MWVHHEQMHNPTAGLQQDELFHIFLLAFLSLESSICWKNNSCEPDGFLKFIYWSKSKIQWQKFQFTLWWHGCTSIHVTLPPSETRAQRVTRIVTTLITGCKRITVHSVVRTSHTCATIPLKSHHLEAEIMFPTFSCLLKVSRFLQARNAWDLFCNIILP